MKQPAEPSLSSLGPPASSTGATRTLERGLAILDCYDADHWGWTLSDICRRTGLAKATVFRLLKTLESRHYLTLDPLTNRYCLGPSMIKAAYVMVPHTELVRQAHPILEVLAAETTETAVLTVWVAERSLTLDCVLTSRPSRPYVRVGQMLSDLRNAHTQVFLAHLPQEELDATLRRLLAAQDNESAVDPQELGERLVEVRRSGVAYDIEQRIQGISAMAMPALDANGQVRASVGVVAPAERFAVDMPGYGLPLKKAAAALSTELGFPGALPPGAGPLSKESSEERSS